jgi:hypothetical protein
MHPARDAGRENVAHGDYSWPQTPPLRLGLARPSLIKSTPFYERTQTVHRIAIAIGECCICCIKLSMHPGGDGRDVKAETLQQRPNELRRRGPRTGASTTCAKARWHTEWAWCCHQPHCTDHRSCGMYIHEAQQTRVELLSCAQSIRNAWLQLLSGTRKWSNNVNPFPVLVLLKGPASIGRTTWPVALKKDTVPPKYYWCMLLVCVGRSNTGGVHGSGREISEWG